MEFYVEHAAPFPVQFRAKWEGLVEGMEWAIERTGTGVLIMPHPGSNPPKYQLKPVKPNAPSDTVTFVLRFYWGDAEREIRRTWDIQRDGPKVRLLASQTADDRSRQETA